MERGSISFRLLHDSTCKKANTDQQYFTPISEQLLIPCLCILCFGCGCISIASMAKLQEVFIRDQRKGCCSLMSCVGKEGKLDTQQCLSVE